MLGNDETSLIMTLFRFEQLLMTQSSSLPSPHASSGAGSPPDYLHGMPHRHYKGGAYAIVGLGRIESDLSQVVVYEAMRDRSQLWVRPLDVFTESVATPQGTQPRFAPDWPAALGCLDFLPRATVLQGLACYDAPYRRYHDRRHVLEMFEAAQARGVALTPAQALAVLFHDAIYVPGCGHNEAASAVLIETMVSGVDASVTSLAARIVMDTRGHRASVPESRLVLDLDLYRLAAQPADFDAWTVAVFEENKALLANRTGLDGDGLFAAFMQRSIAFLQGLAQRTQLFLTPAFADCEAMARANIARMAAAG
jgi:predicted metal-dependent HD superfamily phosphohydrolase